MRIGVGDARALDDDVIGAGGSGGKGEVCAVGDGVTGLGGKRLARDADVKTIGETIKMAQPGDTIHLQPVVYRDYAGVYGKQDALGRPITLAKATRQPTSSIPIQRVEIPVSPVLLLRSIRE